MALSKRPERPPGNRVRTKRVSSQDVHRGGASARGGAEARVPTARRAQVRAASGGACAVRARTHVRAGPAPTRARGAQGAGAGGLLVWGSARQRAPGAEERPRGPSGARRRRQVRVPVAGRAVSSRAAGRCGDLASPQPGRRLWASRGGFVAAGRGARAWDALRPSAGGAATCWHRPQLGPPSRPAFQSWCWRRGRDRPAPLPSLAALWGSRQQPPGILVQRRWHAGARVRLCTATPETDPLLTQVCASPASPALRLAQSSGPKSQVCGTLFFLPEIQW